MLSCDTFAIPAKHAKLQQNMFVKNSDRPLGEAQPLIWVAGETHPSGSTVACTHLTIPQVEKTLGVLGSRPYWIWGFEMGINECGVVIGNEAQGSKNAGESVEGLLGMDLLRLALERGETAYKAMHVIIDLMEAYGQNANASMLFDRRYENSYMLVDKEEIWLLETAGREWIAKKIEEPYGISNCYTITEAYDECSKNLLSLAKEKKWFGKNETFDFAKCYTDPAPRQTMSTPRYRRLCQLLDRETELFDFANSKKIMRDHFEGELIEPRYGAGYGTFVTICMHAMTWDSSQTAAALMSTYDEVLGVVSRHAFSMPCCSVFMPLYFTGYLPEMMQVGGETYDEASMWWVMECLEMLVSIDYNRFAPKVRSTFAGLEVIFAEEAKETEAIAKVYIQEGEKAEGYAVLNAQMDAHCKQIVETTMMLSEEIRTIVTAEGGLSGARREFLLAYGEKAKLPLVK